MVLDNLSMQNLVILVTNKKWAYIRLQLMPDGDEAIVDILENFVSGNANFSQIVHFVLFRSNDIQTRYQVADFHVNHIWLK